MLLPFAGSIADADARLAPRLDRRAAGGDRRPSCRTDWADAQAYAAHLAARLGDRAGFVEEAEGARG